jgi:hypothetical protein
MFYSRVGMGLMGSGIHGVWRGWSEALVGVMERMRCCRCPCGWGYVPIVGISSAMWQFGVGLGRQW